MGIAPASANQVSARKGQAGGCNTGPEGLCEVGRPNTRMCNNLYVATDDGSYGHKGFVTDVVKQLIESGRSRPCHSHRPLVMMKMVCRLTKEYGILTP